MQAEEDAAFFFTLPAVPLLMDGDSGRVFFMERTGYAACNRRVQRRLTTCISALELGSGNQICTASASCRRAAAGKSLACGKQSSFICGSSLFADAGIAQ
ncbi:MAG: hypothetical protein ACLTSZ_03740 [Lachnospiraceae bacterium]